MIVNKQKTNVEKLPFTKYSKKLVQTYSDWSSVITNIEQKTYIILGQCFMLLHWVSFSCLVSVILIVSVCTATGAWNWLTDPDTQKVRISVQTYLVVSFLA